MTIWYGTDDVCELLPSLWIYKSEKKILIGLQLLHFWIGIGIKNDKAPITH